MKVEELPIPGQAKKVIMSTQITSLYPPQKEAVEAGALDGENLVLASPTASGKTLIAELCAIKQVVESGGKVLYLTPLRALASEKLRDFKKYSTVEKGGGRRVKVAISTGDYDASDPWLGGYDIIITTNEKCDSLLRHRPDWLEDVTLVVADEVHILRDRERGPTLEVTLTRLRENNPRAQILALSATIMNTEEIAEWLGARPITTSWRPVKLVEGVYLKGECQFNNGASISIAEEDKSPTINVALHTVRDGGQALIFAITRRRAVSYAKRAGRLLRRTLTKNEVRALKTVARRIERAGEKTGISKLLARLVEEGVAFHHAGLTAPHRKIIEEWFRRGIIKVVAATPTLAAGVNVPARVVVIPNTRRYHPGLGLYDISVLEYKQMAGRAGRPRYDDIGESVLIAKNEDEHDFLMERYVFSKPERIWSKLAVEKTLRSHVLSSVASAYTRSEEALNAFFRRTFYSHQFDPFIIDELVNNIVRYLCGEGMLVVNGGELEATRFGSRVSELYVDPISAVILRDGFGNRPKAVTELSLLQLICHTPDVYPKFYPRKRELDGLTSFIDIHSEELFFTTPENGDFIEYESFLGEIKCASVLDSWIREVSEDGIMEKYSVEPGDLFRLISSVEWLLHAAQELSSLLGHRDLKPELSSLQRRVEKGVREELLPLAALEGVGRARGRILYNAGFKTLKELKGATISQLIELPLIGSRMAKRIKDQVGGMVKKEELWAFTGSSQWQQKAISDFYGSEEGHSEA